MFCSTLKCFFILETVLLSHAFFHEKSKKLYSKPSNLKNESLYGFSIAYQPKSSSLFVSAPQGSRQGNVYYINVDTGKTTNDEDFLEGGAPGYDFWLGATVAASPDFFVTCAPRYVEMLLVSKKPKAEGPAVLALCFIKQRKWTELKSITSEDRHKNTTVFRERMDSFGWSIDVAPNGADVLIGGAAMHTGRVSLYKNAMNNGAAPKLINQISGDNPMKYNFGYSIASGNFFSDQTVYAISTTYGDKGYGKVYFFNTNRENIGAIVDEEDVGSMFGAALCSARLRAPALLVGAPTYAVDKYSHNVGAVYIYTVQSTGTNRMKMKRMIKGSTSGGYFGHSIVNLGDLDDDDNDEIAIAAPYEDGGRGAVYIYSGVGILEGKMKEKFHPEGLYTFGFSLATLHNDKESNGLAVGAIGSNNVVVYKSMASITVDLQGSVNVSKKATSEESKTLIEIESCVHVEYPKKPVKVEADLNIAIKITDQLCTLDKGKDKYAYVEKIRGRKSPLCHKNIQANCSNNEHGRLIISYEITATLLGSPDSTMNYDDSAVLLSDRSHLSYSGNEYSRCDGGTCEPVLELHINSTIPKKYIVGSSESERVFVRVTNAGDTAYDACFELLMRGAVVSRFPPDCAMRAGTERIVCRCKHSIPKDKDWFIGDFTLEPRQDITSTEEYYIEVLHNDCNKKDHADDKIIEKYYLKGDTDSINMTGQTNPEGDVDVSPDVLRTKGKSFEHLYVIENKGITNWNGMQVQITLPDALYIKYSEVPIEITTAMSYLKCFIDNSTRGDSTIVTSCNIGDLLKSTTTFITISMKIVPNKLELDENKPNITVTTTLKLLGINISLSEVTLVKLEVASVPTWVVATASVIGLLLFSLVVFALYVLGFLERKNKDKLVALKREVYRQSVRRSAIRESMRAATRRKSTEDIQFLTDAEEHSQDGEMTIDEKLRCHK